MAAVAAHENRRPAASLNQQNRLLASVDYDESLITEAQIQEVAAGASEGSADLLAWVDANCGA